MKKNTSRNIVTMFVSGLLLIIASCTAPTQGIFWSISQEIKIDKKTNGIPNDVSTNRFVIFDSPSYRSLLVISGTRLFINDRNGSGEPAGTWQEARRPDGRDTCIDVAVSTSAVYAIFSSDTQTNSRLYRAVFTGAGNASGLDWQMVQGINEGNNSGVDRVFSLSAAIGDKVLAQVTTDTSVLSPSHKVWLINGSSGAVAVKFNGVYHEGGVPTVHSELAGSYALNSVSVHGANVWASSYYDLYHITTGTAALELGGTDPRFGRVASAALLPSGHGTFRATSVDTTTNRLYVVTSTGYVHRTTSTAIPTLIGDWVSAQKSEYNLKSISPINLADQADPPPTIPAPLIGTLAAGTSNSKGIVTIKDDGTSLTILGNTSDNAHLYNSNYSSSNVASKSVNDVVWSGAANEPFFITTSKLGLWSVKYKSNYSKDGVSKQGLEFTWE